MTRTNDMISGPLIQEPFEMRSIKLLERAMKSRPIAEFK